MWCLLDYVRRECKKAESLFKGKKTFAFCEIFVCTKISRILAAPNPRTSTIHHHSIKLHIN